MMNLINSLRFRMDTTRYLFDKPKLNYQPLPWVGIQASRRAIGCKDRMNSITRFLSDNDITDGTVIDIGSNVGFFSFSFMELGYTVFAVEIDKRSLRIADYVSHKLRKRGVSGTYTPMNLLVNHDTLDQLPNADITLCLSVWHHWVKDYGLDDATKILKNIWKSSSKVMFFDSGGNEMGKEYNMPFGETDAHDWLFDYLSRECDHGKVTLLGEYQAISPRSASKMEGITQRSLFALSKVN